jgi:hypothetical protein
MVNYLYTLKEVNQMEREMCSYLEWILHVEAAELEAFSQHVRKECGKDCPAVPPQWVASVGIPPVVTSAAATTAVVSATSLVSTVEASRSQVAAASSLPSPGSSPSSSSSGDSSPDSPDECLNPSSTEDPTQQPTIAMAQAICTLTHTTRPLRQSRYLR